MSMLLKGALTKHQIAFNLALKRLLKKKWTNLLTILAIGISLTLPSLLWLCVQNANAIRGTWHAQTQLSVFLSTALSSDDSQGVLDKIEQYPQVAYVNYISAKEGLRLLEEQSGGVDLLQQLETNPLPSVVELFPKPAFDNEKDIEALSESLRTLPEVALVKVDMQWVKRLTAIIHLVKTFFYVVAGLLAIAVLLTISNTIRLLIQSYKQEILVLKLIGATNRFIARPFLYYGMLFGLFGALIAGFVISVIGFTINGLANDIAKLYYSNFHFYGLNLKYGMILALMGLGLGFIGAKIAVNQQIKALEGAVR